MRATDERPMIAGPRHRLLGAALAVAVFGVAVLLCDDARGQPASGDAVITAMSHRPFETPAPIIVEYEEDTEINSRLAAVIASELRRRGFTLVERGAPLVLRVSTGVPTFTERPQTSLELEGRGGTGSRTRITGNVRIPLGPGGQPGPTTPRRTEIEMLLRDSANLALWTGRAEALPSTGDRYEKLSRLARLLIDRIGANLETETVPLH